MGKLQREVNSGFVATCDASHGMESLFDDVEKGFPWLERVLSIIDKVHSRYSGSPKKKRELRRTADIFDLVYISLKRIVETRYIKFSVLAGDTLLKMFKSLILVLEDDISNTEDAGAKGVLSSLLLRRQFRSYFQFWTYSITLFHFRAVLNLVNFLFSIIWTADVHLSTRSKSCANLRLTSTSKS